MAFRMQASVPELTDMSREPEEVLEMLRARRAADRVAIAANCLLARRLVERGVRFVQLYHRGWDNHGGLPLNIPKQCKDIDQPNAALIRDLKQRGLLDDTLVIWGGEFGRTVYGQGGLTSQLRPRPSRPLLHDVGGRRRLQARHRPRRDRRLRLQHRPRSGLTSTISTRRCCTAWASTTNA